MHTSQLDPTSLEDIPELAELDATAQQRLVDLLDAYMIGVEEGRPVDRRQLLAANADIADLLEQYLDGLDLLHQATIDSHDTRVDSSNSTIDLHATASRRPGNVSRLQESGIFELGPYRLGPVVGQGAMGIVYQARDMRLERDVALKVLTYGVSVDATRIDRFRREAKTAASLDHPNVVPVYTVGHSQGMHYYAMQLIEGESLDRRIVAARCLVAEQECPDTRDALQRSAAPLVGGDRYRRIAQFCASAAGALHAAHLVGIIHRDVKPSNLLLGYDGQLWVTDFGLARVQAEAGLTRSGELVGTVRYMSPEQARGQGDLIDARTDVYALGATLYELVTLQPAFAGDDTLSLLQAIQSAEPTPPRSCNPHIPKDLETIILRAMRPHPADRYSTAAAMASDLQRFVEGKPISAHSPTVGERLTEWVRRHRTVAACLLAIWFISLLASSTTTFLVTHEHRQTVEALSKAEWHAVRARRAVDSLSAKAFLLGDIAEAAPIRMEVLREALGYYEEFVAASVDDPNLLEDVARTRLEIARLTSLTGSHAEAEQAYQVAVSDLQQAAEKEQAEVGEQSQLELTRVRALNEWALLASDYGDQTAALQRLALALEAVGHSVSHSGPTTQAALLARALTYNNRGVVRMRADQFAQGESDLMQAVQLLSKLSLSELSPELAKSERAEICSDLTSELADAFSNASAVLSENEHFAQAAAAAEQSIRLRSLRLQSLSGDATEITADQLSRLAITHNNFASLLWRSGNTVGAVDAYRDAVKLLERSIQSAPGQTAPRDRLAVTLNNLGMAYASAGNTTEAERALTRAASLAQPALDADPSDIEAAKRLGGIYNNLGVLLRDSDRLLEASDLLTKAKRLMLTAGGLSDSDAQQQTALAQIQANLESLQRVP